MAYAGKAAHGSLWLCELVPSSCSLISAPGCEGCSWAGVSFRLCHPPAIVSPPAMAAPIYLFLWLCPWRDSPIAMSPGPGSSARGRVEEGVHSVMRRTLYIIPCHPLTERGSGNDRSLLCVLAPTVTLKLAHGAGHARCSCPVQREGRGASMNPCHRGTTP